MKKISGIIVLCALAIPLFNAEAGRPQPRVTITSPAPYQSLRQGLAANITWEATANVGTVNLSYRDRSTGTKQLIRENIPASARQAYWPIPSTLANGEYDLILEEPRGYAIHTIQVKLEGTNARTFSNANEMVAVTSPNGGEMLSYGTPSVVTWDHSGLGNKKLDILLGAPNRYGVIAWTYIASGIPGNWDRFTWIPDRQLTEIYLQQQQIQGPAHFKIMILDPHNRNVKDTSDGYFVIQ